MRRAFFFTAAATLAIASPLRPRQAETNDTSPSASQPSVTIYPETSNGQPITLTGRNAIGVDSYYGLPFAVPPVGELRFTAPQSPLWNVSEFDATAPSPACIQSESASYTANFGSSEDCLYLNVQAPAGSNAQSTFLPVVVWVYGGSFTSGSASFYDGSILVSRSVQTEQPVIFVSLNYRLGILGFPNGDEAATNNAANLGLRDVQKALEWVQENIWAFGGDPDRVTVAGQSAGAILISLLYLQPEINLFRGAIMQSGAQSTAPIGPTGTTWQGPYDALVEFAGCGAVNGSGSGANATGEGYEAINSTAPSASSSSWECLKGLSAEELLAAQEQVTQIPQYSLAFVFGPSIDGDLIPDSPHNLLAAGEFAQIPFISGNMKDEGTGFLPTTPEIYSNVTLSAVAFATIEPVTPDQSTLQELFGVVYPDVAALGSPFGTGNETFGLPSAYKQLAAILGDAAFQANRRWFIEQSNAYGFDQTWSYTFDSAPPATPARLGAYHGADVPYVFGLPIAAAAINATGAIADGAGRYNFTEADVLLSTQVIDYWVNFAYYADPNGDGQGDATYWPSYGEEKNLITFETGGNLTIVPDTYREEQIGWFLERPEEFNYKRSVEA